MSENVILVERAEGIATVTLNRPEALNALSRQLSAEIARTFRELQEDRGVRVAILTGAGRAFCAGVDLKELGSGGGAPSESTEKNDLLEAVEAFDRPLIGAINGFCITGGFELALMCDLLIGSTAARFADTHARVGIVMGWGLSQRLARWIGIGRAKELSFTGNYLDAERAAAWGLLNRVVAPEELLPTCVALARDMISCDPLVLNEIKRIIDAGWETTLAEGMRIEDQASRDHMKRVSSDEVEARRQGILQRGRQQTSG